MAITYTQDDLDQLKDALVTGLTELTVQGRTMKFRTKDELISLIGMIEESLSSSDAESDFQIGGFNRKGDIDE